MKGGGSQNDLIQIKSEQWQRLHLDSPSLLLKPHEKLQVHMDIMNAVGEIVSIEDVDDLGGSVSKTVEMISSSVVYDVVIISSSVVYNVVM